MYYPEFSKNTYDYLKQKIIALSYGVFSVCRYDAYDSRLIKDIWGWAG